MTHFEDKAVELRAAAEKKMTSKGFFEMLFGGGANRMEQAISYYKKAGNLFKMAKNWLQAGNAYCDAGNLNYRNNDLHEAANNYIDAANCFKRSDVTKAVKYILKAVEIYTNMGKFLLAAKYHQMSAEMLEEESQMNQAIQHYQQAADYFRGEDSHLHANKCLLKVAEHAALEEKYEKAVEIFQQIACFDLASSLLKYNVKEYLFRAAICHLCTDHYNVNNVLKHYVQMYPAFEDSREYNLIVCLGECIDNLDPDSFTEAVKKYDAISKLPQWYTTMLLRIKRRIAEKPDLR